MCTDSIGDGESVMAVNATRGGLRDPLGVRDDRFRGVQGSLSSSRASTMAEKPYLS